MQGSDLRALGSRVFVLMRIAGILIILAHAAGTEAQTPNCTVNWITNGDGAWSNGQNWDGGDPPQSTDVVCIMLDGNYTVTVAADATVQELYLGSADNQGTQALQAQSSFSIGVQTTLQVAESGYLQLTTDSAVWGQAGALMQNFGMIGMNGGQIALDTENYGEFRFVGTCSVASGFANQSGSVLRTFDSSSAAALSFQQGMLNYGTIYLIGSDNLSITAGPGTQLKNEPGGWIRAGQSVKERAPKAGVAPPSIIGEFLNEGTLWVGDNGVRLLGDGVSSSNAVGAVIQLLYGNVELDLTGNTAKAASSFTNLGSIDIGAGMSFDVSTASGKTGTRAASSFTNLGSIDIGAGGGFSVSQSFKDGRAASSFTNLGSIDISSGGTFLCEGASFANEQNTRGTEGVISGLGTLDLSGASSVYNNAGIEPGTSTTRGQLSYFGDLPQGSSAGLRFDLGGTAPGSFDVLKISNALQKVGALELYLVDGFIPVEGDSFEIMTYQGAEGFYADTALFPSLGGGLGWELSESQSRTEAQVVCTDGSNLRILDVSEDKDPVSVNSVLTFAVTVDAVVGDTGVSLDVDLGSDLVLDQVDVGDCAMSGSVLHCDLVELASYEQQEIIFSVVPITSGDLSVPFRLSGDFCDTSPADNSWDALVHAISAQPCDADADGMVDRNDLPVAVGQFYGTNAPGNPDCSDDGELDAMDLSLILIDAGS